MKTALLISTRPEHDNFNDPLRRALKNLSHVDEVHCDQLDSITDLPEDTGLVVVAGVPAEESKAYGNDIVERQAKILAPLRDIEHPVPVLGICAGHQALGEVFGEGVYENQEDYVTTVSVEPEAKDDPILVDMPHEFDVRTMHRNAIMVPERFKLLGSTTICRNKMMRHESKPIYGVQFHPELSWGRGFLLLSNMVQIARDHHATALVPIQPAPDEITFTSVIAADSGQHLV